MPVTQQDGAGHQMDLNRSFSTFLQRKDRWGNVYALWVLAFFLVTLPVIGRSLQKLKMENSIDQWLPGSDPQMQVLEWFEHEFGHEEYVIASWEGSHWEDNRIGTFASALREQRPGRPAGIIRVTTPQEILDQMVRNGVSEEEARLKLAGVLTSASPVGPVALSIQIDEKLAPPTSIVRQIQTAAAHADIAPEQLHLAGGLLTRVALDKSVQAIEWNPDVPWWMLHRLSPTVMSALISVSLALLLLRSPRLAGMVLIVSVYTAFATVALIPATGGSMNMVLVVLPTLLMVLTLSGAIHLANYWKHAAAENRDTAVASAIQMAGQPCFLAVATTAVGMLSLLTSELGPVRDFGWLSAVGVTLSLGLILVGLPMLLTLWPPRRIRISEEDHRLWSSLGTWLARHRHLAGGACLAATVLATAGLIYFRTETKLIRFFPENSTIVADYQFLERNICGVVPVDLIIAFGPDACAQTNSLSRMALVRKVEEKLREHSDISGTLSLADFRPTLPVPASSAPFLLKARYHRTASELQDRLNDPFSSIHGLAHPIQTSLVVEDQERSVDLVPGTEVWRIKANAAALTRADYGSIIHDLQTQAGELLQDQPDTISFVTGTVPLFLRTQEAVLESLIESFGVAFLLIEIILVILLRGFLAGTLAMLPNVFPVIFVFGAVAWCGIPIDIGSMVTASVALGIAIDGTVHLLTWFTEGLRKGLTREQAIAQSLAHCGPAMWHTSAIICAGLLVLLGADLLLVSRFGWLMAALVFAALIGDVIYLPTLLAGSLGDLIEQRVRATATLQAGDPRQPGLTGSDTEPAEPAPILSPSFARIGSDLPGPHQKRSVLPREVS